MFQQEHFTILRAKLGLTTVDEGDEELAQDFLDLLERSRSDFTLAFRRLGELTVDTTEIEALFDFPESFAPWLESWRQRCAQETISDAVNPVFIPRNHLVEEAISQAYAGDFALFHRLNERLSMPFDFDAADAGLAIPPEPDQVVHQTFCGT
jgi:uncharacterized protein YdiU (UPF0061 family)